MEKIISNKIFGSVVLLAWGYILLLQFFWRNNYPDACVSIGLQELLNICEAAWLYLLIFVPVGILLILLVILKSEVLEKWKKFTMFFLSLYFVLYIFTPTDAPDFILFYKETVAIGAVLFYSVVSLIYLIYLKSRKA